jgi:hypothetical protein
VKSRRLGVHASTPEMLAYYTTADPVPRSQFVDGGSSLVVDDESIDLSSP